MRILHTANTYAPSLDGVAEVVRNISERLVKRGHEVHVATAAIGSARSSEDMEGVHVHRFSARGSLSLGMKGELERYCAFVRSGNWDILVNHALHVWSTDLLLRDVTSFPWPSVLVSHGFPDQHLKFQEYYDAIVPRCLPAYQKWIRVSGSGAELAYAQRFELPGPLLITNGVDKREWARPAVDLRRIWGIGEKPWVVNVSNHCPVKNHEAFFRLAKSLRDSDAHFTLVAGTYPMARWGLGKYGFSGGCAYRCKLRSIVTPGILDLRVDRPREEVISAIKEADLLVSTSSKEANSLVLLESMAAGVPWVSFDVGSARVNAGGVVVRDLDEMKDVVSRLLRNAELRRKLGNAGRAQIAEKHSWDTIVDQYERLYERAVGERSASSSEIRALGGRWEGLVCR